MSDIDVTHVKPSFPHDGGGVLCCDPPHLPITAKEYAVKPKYGSAHHPRWFRLAVAVGTTALLLSACGGETQPATGSGATDAETGSGSNKTIVFSPLGLQIPAMKGLSEGVQHYGEEQGYEVLVQDPALDPQKQITDLQSVIESGRAGRGPSSSSRPGRAR
jgi:hypothetical protein